MLILTLVIVVILGASVVALARYATVNLRYGDVSERAARQRAAADGALASVVDQIRVGVAPCLYDNGDTAIPATNLSIEGIVPTATCRSFGGPIDSTQAWAAVITGEGTGANGLIQTTSAADTTISGRLWMSNVNGDALSAIEGAAIKVAAPLVHADSTGCTVLPSTIQTYIVFSEALVDRPVCVGTGWQDQPSFDSPPVPELASLPPGSFVDVPSCRVFQPGVYDDDPLTAAPALPDTAGIDTYFAPGDYVFRAGVVATGAVRFRGGSDVVAGKDPSISPQDLGGWTCGAALGYTSGSFPLGGVTFYLDGRAHIVIENGADLEIMPRPQSGGLPISVQALTTSTHTVNPIPDGASSNLNRSIIRIADDPSTRVRIHGLVYGPRAQVRLQGTSDGGRAVDLWGGLVAARLWSEVRTVIRASTPSPPAPIRLLVTAKATLSGNTTSMQANVTYDPSLPIADRATITAWNLCDAAC